jgi:CarD family transcriptional regulator
MKAHPSKSVVPSLPVFSKAGFFLLRSTTKELSMQFEIGDKVVHQMYGVGEIIQDEEKTLSGQTTHYYVVKIRDLTVWVPVKEVENHSLRPPTPTNEFGALFKILGSANEPLPADRMERKSQLTDQLNSRGLEGICRVVRDLSKFRKGKSLYDAEKNMLERAQNLLLEEWSLALSVPRPQAERELRLLLEGSSPA